jgi:type I restriction-modification system DNA methylase subunit
LKILDPACGSGAFLNQALNYLRQEHDFIDESIKTLMGGSVLGLYDVKKDILENNLYGVDINAEAVEIAKLSLWLRTVESGRKLNKLADKIKVGNSLIDDRSVAEDAFVWEEEFPEVFPSRHPELDSGSRSEDGFDVVIGNPPYIRVQGLKANYEDEAEYYEKRYQSAVGNYDIYVLFMERSFALLNERGKLSFILPNKFLVSSFGRGIRNVLRENKAVESLLHFGSYMVFEDASAYTCIILLSYSNKVLKFKNIEPKKIFEDFQYDVLEYKELTDEKWNLASQDILKVLEKINNQPLSIKDKFEKIFQGLKTGADSIFVLKGKMVNAEFVGYSEALHKLVTLEKNLVIPLLKGDDIDRYKYLKNSYYVLFPYKMVNNKAVPLLAEEIKHQYPLVYKYLLQNSTYLKQREKGRFNNEDEWFLFSRNQGINNFNQSKIVFQEMGYSSKMSFDDKGYCVIRQYSMIKYKDTEEDYKFYLAIFNSSLMWFFIKNTSTELRGGYFMYQTKYLEPFPLPALVNIEDQMPYVENVDDMLELNKTFQTKQQRFLKRVTDNLNIEKISKKLEAFYEHDFKTFLKELKKKKITLSLIEQDEWEAYFNDYKTELTDLQTQIDNTDKEIDKMVYELYGLTEEEIAVVEGDI